MALVASREVGGIQKHFNVGALNKIPFPLPPIELQNKFAAIVEKGRSPQVPLSTKPDRSGKPIWRTEPEGVQGRTGFVAGAADGRANHGSHRQQGRIEPRKAGNGKRGNWNFLP